MNLSNPGQIHMEEYNYSLPDERIATYPLEKRDSSKLLLYKDHTISEDTFSSLPDHLPADSLLVFNNTKVIQARMHFKKETGAQIEIFCLDPAEPHDYALIFQQTERCSWHCLVGNLKKWKSGELRKEVSAKGISTTLTVRRTQSNGEHHIIEFSWDSPAFTFADLLDATGELPIPPYLKRDTEEADKDTYQTVYSKIKGSVAAPTAGLHFTPEVLADLEAKGFGRTEVTLHVGAGTFKPVKTQTIAEHEMHSEFISVERRTIEALQKHKGQVIAVGTTSVRTIESLYYIGENLGRNANTDLKVDQWQPYQDGSNLLEKKMALQNILNHLDKNNLNRLLADTQIIIAPGYEFKIVDGIVTNFHQPKSTLLLLVSALVKGDWRRIYDYALAHNFRFLSYGDSSLLMKG
ncbi:MAG: putative S-adenosylmethionine:tRNA ribosyltransferase-isomerase [Bacteroidetes bacterium]|nr:putative S-adenosylmethionine:tRNA ribosyltransferase-isomerase [Bacteroidota bacterium]